jgi:hypothetical protein
VQAKSSAAGGRRVCKRRARQTKCVAIKRGKQKRIAKLLIRSKVARHRDRCGHPENCLKRPAKNREIAWTVLKRLGLRGFETGTKASRAASSGRLVYASWAVSMLLSVVNGPCCAMPAAAACPTPATPPAAGPAPAFAAGANPPAGPPTPALASASAASMASRTARARARVAAPPAFRAPGAAHPRPAVLRTPHHRRPAHALARCTSTIDLGVRRTSPPQLAPTPSAGPDS